MTTRAPSAQSDSVAIFYREAEHFTIKELRLHGQKFIRFQLVTGRRQWHIVGFYIDPRNASTIEDVATATRDQLYGDKLLMTSDLNSNLVEPEGTP